MIFVKYAFSLQYFIDCSGISILHRSHIVLASDLCMTALFLDSVSIF